MGMGQNPIPLVNIKIAGKWMFIPLKMILIGIDPYPYGCFKKYINIVNALNFFTFSVTTIPIPVFLIRFPGSFLDGEVWAWMDMNGAMVPWGTGTCVVMICHVTTKVLRIFPSCGNLNAMPDACQMGDHHSVWVIGSL